MACFASLIAPFGGFFASGVKRAFDIKDFGQSIPGHGGMTDRMDCQFLMGLFAYMYHQSFIKVRIKVQLTVGLPNGIDIQCFRWICACDNNKQPDAHRAAGIIGTRIDLFREPRHLGSSCSPAMWSECAYRRGT